MDYYPDEIEVSCEDFITDLLTGLDQQAMIGRTVRNDNVACLRRTSIKTED